MVLGQLSFPLERPSKGVISSQQINMETIRTLEGNCPQPQELLKPRQNTVPARGDSREQTGGGLLGLLLCPVAITAHSTTRNIPEQRCVHPLRHVNESRQQNDRSP